MSVRLSITRRYSSRYKALCGLSAAAEVLVKMQHGRRPPCWKSFFAHNAAADCLNQVKFCVGLAEFSASEWAWLDWVSLTVLTVLQVEEVMTADVEDRVSVAILRMYHGVMLDAYSPRQVIGDENCPYRAVSLALYGTKSLHICFWQASSWFCIPIRTTPVSHSCRPCVCHHRYMTHSSRHRWLSAQTQNWSTRMQWVLPLASSYSRTCFQVTPSASAWIRTHGLLSDVDNARLPRRCLPSCGPWQECLNAPFILCRIISCS